jgi:hypothetical protein
LALMKNIRHWDWVTKEKRITDITRPDQGLTSIHQFVVSTDGERIASIGRNARNDFVVCENGRPWNSLFTNICSLQFTPDGRLAVIGSPDKEWTVCVNDQNWEGKFEFVWNLQSDRRGRILAVQVKSCGGYGLCVNGRMWERAFPGLSEYVISPDGKCVAAAVQIKTRAEQDAPGPTDAVWSVAVNGVSWDTAFMYARGLAVSPDGLHIAAAVDIGQAASTIAVDGQPWDKVFEFIWEPCFDPRNGDVIVPGKTPKGWTVLRNGDPVWRRYFFRLLKPRFSPDRRSMAAFVSPRFGAWTIAVNGEAWRQAYKGIALEPVFSPNSKHVACVVLMDHRWSIAVDGHAWDRTFDMIWDPVFSPVGDTIAAKAELDGKFFLVVDGRVVRNEYDMLWNPVFSPDGSTLLVRAIQGGCYYRRLVPLGTL